MAAPKMQIRHKKRPTTMAMMIHTMGRQIRSSRKSRSKGSRCPSTSTQPRFTPLITCWYRLGMMSWI